jgi:hypothetical protein
MNDPIKMDQWSLVTNLDPASAYLTPEQRVSYLYGRVYGHPKHPDGKRVQTSRITEVDGDIVETRSGNKYQLLDADEKYVAECEINGWRVPTKEEPIHVQG